jgi:uncharacterized membrane protein
LFEFGEKFLSVCTIVRPVYRGLKQVFETLFSKSGSTFRTVGLVEFPAPGMSSLVFLSTPPRADVMAHPAEPGGLCFGIRYEVPTSPEKSQIDHLRFHSIANVSV